MCPAAHTAAHRGGAPRSAAARTGSSGTAGLRCCPVPPGVWHVNEPVEQDAGYPTVPQTGDNNQHSVPQKPRTCMAFFLYQASLSGYITPEIKDSQAFQFQ